MFLELAVVVVILSGPLVGRMNRADENVFSCTVARGEFSDLFARSRNVKTDADQVVVGEVVVGVCEEPKRIDRFIGVVKLNAADSVFVEPFEDLADELVRLADLFESLG